MSGQRPLLCELELVRQLAALRLGAPFLALIRGQLSL